MRVSHACTRLRTRSLGWYMNFTLTRNGGPFNFPRLKAHAHVRREYREAQARATYECAHLFISNTKSRLTSRGRSRRAPQSAAGASKISTQINRDTKSCGCVSPVLGQ